MRTIQQLAQSIVKFRLIDNGKFAFDYCGETMIFREPTDIILGDNEQSKLWIARQYAYILELFFTQG